MMCVCVFLQSAIPLKGDRTQDLSSEWKLILKLKLVLKIGCNLIEKISPNREALNLNS